MADPRLQHGTRADLDAAAAAGQLVPFLAYLIDEEERIAVALTPSTYRAYAKEAEPGAAVAAHEAAADPHTQYALDVDLAAHTGDTNNPHATTAAQVGADPAGTASAAISAHEAAASAHPISGVAGLQAALDTKAPLDSPVLTGTPTAPTPTAGDNTTKISTTAFVQAALAALVASSPAALDTLNELAAALGNDPNFATTVTTAIAGKQPLDATLTALAAITTAADRLIYATGPDAFAIATLTAFARTLLDDADAAAARATLGLGSAATYAAGANPDQVPAGHMLGSMAFVSQTWLYASADWDPDSIAAGAAATTTVSVPGAELGDFAFPARMTSDGLMVTAEVSAADTVTLNYFNPTGSAIDMASHTVHLAVLKRIPQ